MTNLNKPAKGFNLRSYHDWLLKHMAPVYLSQFPFFFFRSFVGFTYFSGIEVWSLKTSVVIYARNMPKPVFFPLFDIFQTMVKYRRDNCLTHEVIFTLMHLKWCVMDTQSL